MVKLVVDNTKPRPTLVTSPPDPQEYLDNICNECFLKRGYYLTAISKKQPFDVERAKEILKILTSKGGQDPKSHALGHSLRKAILAFK